MGNQIDLHTHSLYSDGKNTPEEMIKAAISIGMKKIGISDHSYTDFDLSYCVKLNDIDKRINEISLLKEKYRDKITVLCGIEQDYFATFGTEKYDYSIGSVHYIKKCGEYIDVDNTREILLSASDRLYGGDIYALLEDYYKEEADIIEKTNADIIGHFDLICKLNEKTPFFDEKNPRYEAAWKSAADKLLKSGKPFEINSGAIQRGYKTTPYPSPYIKEYLKERGAKFIFTSDSHSAEALIKYNK